MDGENISSTQELKDLTFSQCSDDEESVFRWGRLFSMTRSPFALPDIDLWKETFTLGRAKSCDLCVSKVHLRDTVLNSISAVHFTLKRIKTGSGWHVELVDNSRNGTYVNGQNVGRNNRTVLTNNAEIAVSLRKLKFFIFHDYSEGMTSSFPPELCEKYTVSKLLGTGACGEVRLAFKKGTAERCAVKIVSRNRLSGHGRRAISMSETVANELEVASSLNHPCVIRVLDMVSSPAALCLVMELVEGGELLARVQAHGQLSEQLSKLYFYQMLKAVEYLHSHGVVHRDLKPENVLLASEHNHCLVKIGDFGLAKLLGDSMCLRTVCGTASYVAPEVLRNHQQPQQQQHHPQQLVGSYSWQADCWSLGVILFICLGGYPPFSVDYADMPLTEQILRARYSFPASRWRRVGANATDLVRRLLTPEPQQRICVHDALQHPWLQDNRVIQLAERLMARRKTHSSDAGYFPQAKRARNDTAAAIAV